MDYRSLAADQDVSEEIAAYRTSITVLKFEDVYRFGVKILCNISTDRPRPVIPREWNDYLGNKKKLVECLHENKDNK